MSFKFYYDSLLGDEDLTYTIYAKKNSSSRENVNNFVSSESNRAIMNFGTNDLTEVFTDFIQDSFSISVSHSYEGGGSTLENVTENVVANFRSAAINARKYTEEAYNTLAQFVNSMGEYDNTVKFNKVLSSSDYYKAWGGGEVSIPLNFSSRIYSREVGGSIMAPTDIIANINKYFLPTAIRANNSGYDAYTVIQPPNGYNASQIDQLNPRGTFCIRYGKKKMANLLLHNYNFQMSREVGEDGSSLYADVSFSFIPATYLTSYEINDLLGVSSRRVNVVKPANQGGGNVQGSVAELY